MIALFDEDLLTLAEAARVLPRLGGKKPHTSTLWRWCAKGLRGVRLEHARVGHRVVTSRQALDRFSRRLAESSLARFRVGEAHARAEAQLDDAGL